MHRVSDLYYTFSSSADTDTFTDKHEIELGNIIKTMQPDSLKEILLMIVEHARITTDHDADALADFYSTIPYEGKQIDNDITFVTANLPTRLKIILWKFATQVKSAC